MGAVTTGTFCMAAFQCVVDVGRIERRATSHEKTPYREARPA
jgi:hypothetical protein